MRSSDGDAELTGECIVVLITTPSLEEAEKLAQGMLKERLAACANIVRGVRSLFWWDGKLDEADECMLFCKTRSELAEALTNFVTQNHEYEVPEVIALPIMGGNDDYLKWIYESTIERRNDQT